MHDILDLDSSIKIDPGDTKKLKKLNDFMLHKVPTGIPCIPMPLELASGLKCGKLWLSPPLPIYGHYVWPRFDGGCSLHGSG